MMRRLLILLLSWSARDELLDDAGMCVDVFMGMCVDASGYVDVGTPWYTLTLAAAVVGLVVGVAVAVVVVVVGVAVVVGSLLGTSWLLM